MKKKKISGPSVVGKIKHTDYEKKENQIGCGYCAYEKTCSDRDPKINKAKQGCKKFTHFADKG